LHIDKDASKFIKKDSKAIISTEGLLGNKYIKISGGTDKSPTAMADDQLESLQSNRYGSDT